MRGVSLGRWFGVPVSIHYSWFVIAALFTVSLVGEFSAANPNWSRAVIWMSAAVAVALFFLSVLLHELSHAIVAQAGGLAVRGITLFALGGVASMERDAESASHEFWVAMAGPTASVLIGVVCSTVAAAAGWVPGHAASSPAIAVVGWLGYVNLGLAFFNLLPAFPLDGGRIFRAAIWAFTGNMERATRIAAGTGRVAAILLIGFGLAQALLGGNTGGLWVAFIGWFLLEAAGAEIARLDHPFASQISH